MNSNVIMSIKLFMAEGMLGKYDTKHGMKHWEVEEQTSAQHVWKKEGSVFLDS